MKKKTLRQINMNIETTKELISGYEDKLEKLKNQMGGGIHWLLEYFFVYI